MERGAKTRKNNSLSIQRWRKKKEQERQRKPLGNLRVRSIWCFGEKNTLFESLKKKKKKNGKFTKLHKIYRPGWRDSAACNDTNKYPPKTKFSRMVSAFEKQNQHANLLGNMVWMKILQWDGRYFNLCAFSPPLSPSFIYLGTGIHRCVNRLHLHGHI